MSASEIERELRDRPADWEPWLVYADWLAEQGDARGRLIPLEHRLATAGLAADERARIEHEIVELANEHEQAWAVPDLPEGCELTWERGFIVAARVALELDERDADNDELDRLDALLHHPQARLLGRLRLHCSREIDEDEFDYEDPDPQPELIAEELLARVFALPLAGLRAFAFEYSPLGSHVAGPLRAAGFEQLRELDLRWCHLGSEAAQALAEARFTPALEQLHLQRNRLDADALRGLAGARLDRLRLLDLRDNPLGHEGAAILAEIPLPALKTLYLYRDDVGPEGAELLARSEHLPLAIRRYWKGLAGHVHATHA